MSKSFVDSKSHLPTGSAKEIPLPIIYYPTKGLDLKRENKDAGEKYDTVKMNTLSNLNRTSIVSFVHENPYRSNRDLQPSEPERSFTSQSHNYANGFDKKPKLNLVNRSLIKINEGPFLASGREF